MSSVVPRAIVLAPALSLAIAAAAAATGGCAQPAGDDPAASRRAWLHGALVDDNRRMMLREPALTAGQLRLMAAHPYDWLRGTADLFALDLTTPGSPGYRATGHGGAAAARVRLVGDPHLENVGAYRRGDGQVLADFNDFDGATFGPYWFDVRRLALSFALAARLAEDRGLPATAAPAAARAVAEGYVEELARVAAGAAPTVIHAGTPAGTILDDLLRRADRDGGARQELTDYTDGTPRTVVYGVHGASPIDGVIDDETVALTAAEADLVDALMAEYPATLIDAGARPAGFFAVKGTARRLGAGVRSYPLLRFYVLVEGATADDGDDVLLELKESGDPVAYPVDRFPDLPFVDNGERQVRLQRSLQEGDDDDPLLGWATVVGMAFKVRDRTAYQKGLSFDRLLDKVGSADWVEADVIELARQCGRLLARGHAGAPTLDGAPAAAAIAAALDGDGDGFVDETAGFVAGYLPVVLDDFAIFGALLDDEGPLLGGP